MENLHQKRTHPTPSISSACAIFSLTHSSNTSNVSASISIPILFFPSLRLSLPSLQWRTLPVIFRDSVAPSKTTIGVSLVASPRLPDSTRSIPTPHSTRRTLMPSFGLGPTIQDLPSWPPMGSPLSHGFPTTLMC